MPVYVIPVSYKLLKTAHFVAHRLLFSVVCYICASSAFLLCAFN